MFGVLIILDARHKQAMEYPLMEKIHAIRAREGCKRRMTNDDELVRTVNETGNKAQLPKLVKSCACIQPKPYRNITQVRHLNTYQGFRLAMGLLVALEIYNCGRLLIDFLVEVV